MIFCGQCGLQLSPGSTRCPRCGAMIEGTSTGTVEEMHPDDATTASPAFIPPNQPGTMLPNGQQPLVLRPSMDNGNYNYGTGTPETYDATSRVEAPNFNTRMPSNQNMPPSFPGQGYNQGGLYPTQAAYPEYGTQNAGSYPGQGGAYPGQGMNSQLGGGYASHPSQFPPQQQSLQAANHTKGRVAAMVIILIGLLMVLTAVILFAWQANSGKSSSTNSANGVALVSIERTATTLQLTN